MKKLSILVLAAATLSSCWTSIWTVAPTTERELQPTTVYTTQVTTPSPKVTTTQTITVTSYNNDWSFYLDLQAVAAAFAEANNVQEFERLLNSSRYMINNLDLNRDGYIDYLRVIEIRQGYYHTFLIQDCLAPNVFQDVATLVAEWRTDRLYVEVIGDRYLYGYNYVVRPVFVRRPPMWDYFGRPNYNPWNSPYHHGYYPSYYQYPKPVYLNHYQAYVNTYMTNHHYCHHCDYPQQPYWNGYSSMTQSYHRNDYANEHPNQSFERRVVYPTATVRNAGQLRQEVSRENSAKQTTSTSSSSSSSSSNRTTVTPSSSSTRSSQTTTTTTNRQPQQTSSSTKSTTTTSPSSTGSRTTVQPSTSVNTRVNKSGETRTTFKTVDAQGRTTTTQRTSSSTSSSSSSQRSTATPSSSSQRTSSSSSSSSQRSSGSSSSSSTRSSEPQRTTSSGSSRR